MTANTRETRRQALNATEVTLVQRLANATVTYYRALGHGKAYRNDVRRKQLAKKLVDSGETLPNDEELCRLGKFNGIGSA